jgi:hypothetical protein
MHDSDDLPTFTGPWRNTSPPEHPEGIPRLSYRPRSYRRQHNNFDNSISTERQADTFTEDPEPLGWKWDRCPIDLTPADAVEEGHIFHGQEDEWVGCEGCSGWGCDCAAIWRRP